EANRIRQFVLKHCPALVTSVLTPLIGKMDVLMPGYLQIEGCPEINRHTLDLLLLENGQPLTARDLQAYVEQSVLNLEGFHLSEKKLGDLAVAAGNLKEVKEIRLESHTLSAAGAGAFLYHCKALSALHLKWGVQSTLQGHGDAIYCAGVLPHGQIVSGSQG